MDGRQPITAKNAAKTDILWRSSQRQVDQLQSQPYLLICDSSVGPSTVVRYLDVWIDNGLTISTHNILLRSVTPLLQQLHWLSVTERVNVTLRPGVSFIIIIHFRLLNGMTERKPTQSCR